MGIDSELCVGVWGARGLTRDALLRCVAQQGWKIADVDQLASASEAGFSVILGVVANVRDARIVCQIGTSTARPVVGIVQSESQDVMAELVRSGCLSILSPVAEPDEVVAALELSVRGYAVMPLEISSWLATHIDPFHLISDRELAWMEQLAEGLSVAEVARSAGYAERTLYRLLARLYERLGAHGRYDAVEELHRRGLL